MVSVENLPAKKMRIFQVFLLFYNWFIISIFCSIIYIILLFQERRLKCDLILIKRTIQAGKWIESKFLKN